MDDDKLTVFVNAYRAALLREPHRAVAVAAAAVGIHRATAHRWITAATRAGKLAVVDLVDLNVRLDLIESKLNMLLDIVTKGTA